MTVPQHDPDAAGSAGAFELLHPRAQRWIYDQGWTTLRDIQERSVAAVMDRGRDVIISAATAAGKTEAAFLPILSVLSNARDQANAPAAAEVAKTDGIEVLCVSPLRALINDQYDRLEQMCEAAGVRAHRWHGDVAQSSKQRALRAPSGVLLITPESLEAILVNRGTAVRRFFSRLHYVVIDELHVFLGTPRGAQVQSLLNRVELAIRRRPSRVALSATLADMDKAAAFLHPEHPDQVIVVNDAASENELRLQVRGYTEPAGPPETAASEALATDAPNDMASSGEAAWTREEITGHLFESLRGQDNLIFANARADVEWYADRLRQRSDREHVPNEFWPHHSSLAKGIREAAEKALKDRTRPATSVCTSTLEMGIDIGSLDSIAQIGPPPSVASMRQRLGRSGRRGQPAVLRAYITEESMHLDPRPVDELRCKIVQTIAMVRLMLAGWLEDPDDPGFNYSTLVQQALSMIAQHGGAKNSELHRALCGPGPFQSVDGPRFARLLRSMTDKGLIVEASDGTLLHGAVGEKFVNHHSFYAAFWTPAEWRLVIDGRTLGTVPINFALALGDQLIFAGTRWTVVDVDEPARVIQLVQSKGGRPPKFGGAALLVADRVRQEMATVYESDEMPAWLDPRARELLAEGRAAWRRLGLKDSTVLEHASGVLLFPWVGDRALHTIALALRRSGMTGVSIWGPALQVEGDGRPQGSDKSPTGRRRADLAKIGAAVQNILAQPKPDPSDLATAVTNRRIDKWDWVLDRTLSLEAAGARLLDIEVAWRALERIAADIDSTSGVSSALSRSRG